jgi:hypothetical protein
MPVFARIYSKKPYFGKAVTGLAEKRLAYILEASDRFYVELNGYNFSVYREAT